MRESANTIRPDPLTFCVLTVAKMVWMTQCSQHILVAWFCFLLGRNQVKKPHLLSWLVWQFMTSTSPCKGYWRHYFSKIKYDVLLKVSNNTYCLKIFEMLENTFPYRKFTNNAMKYGWTWPFLLKARISCMRMGHPYLELLSLSVARPWCYWESYQNAKKPAFSPFCKVIYDEVRKVKWN